MNSNGKKEDNDITIKDALIVGICQAIALTPGISRSGMTLVGCLLCGMSRKTSLKYSFMLYFPVSIASRKRKIMAFFTIFICTCNIYNNLFYLNKKM